MREIKQIQKNVKKDIKGALKTSLKFKTIAFCFWAFSSLAVMSMIVAVTAPFSGASIQANIMAGAKAEKIPELTKGFSFLPVGEIAEGKAVIPAEKDAVVGEFLVVTGDEDAMISEIKPCYEDVSANPKVKNLRIKIGDKSYTYGVDIHVDANSVKKFLIIGDLTEETASGNRFRTGFCDEFDIQVGGKKFVPNFEFPVFDAPVSVIGDLPVITI